MLWREPRQDDESWAADYNALSKAIRGPRVTRSSIRWLAIRPDLPVTWYSPLTDTPNLFRIFADVESTETGFLEFAREYGCLDDPWRYQRRRYRSAGRFVYWAETHAQFKAAINYFDATRKRTSLNGHAIPTPGNKMVVEQMNEWLGGGEAGVWRRMTDWLRGHEFGVWGGTNGVAARVLVNEERNRYELKLVPNSLIGAMWLQLAEEMTGSYRFKRCEGCDRWFKAGDLTDPDSRRADARLCIDQSCKMRAKRRRPTTRVSAPKLKTARHK